MFLAVKLIYQTISVDSFFPTKVQQSGNTASGCQLLDKPVGPKCLAALLGLGVNRLKRIQSGGPDLRFGKREYRSKPGTWTVDAFLQVAYDNIAETLPDKSLCTQNNHSNFLLIFLK